MRVFLKCQTFEYDIHSLVKAFYPLENVKIENEPDSNESGCFYMVTTNPETVPGPDSDELYNGELKASYYKDGVCYKEEIGIAQNLDRADLKNLMKRTIYTLLSNVQETTLPWGTLTGIRPCKIPMKLMEEGKDSDAIHNYMKETYMVSDEKIALSTEIATLEKQVIARTSGDKGYSLYVGIPFCPTRCMYCSFTSYPITKYGDKVMEYLGVLMKEISFVANEFRGKQLDSVYIGGGTPTSISAEHLLVLITFIKDSFDFSTVKEFTVEAGRPDSITRDKLEVLKNLGVTRISINPQTMNQKTLDIIGRRHTTEQIKEAFALAREVGFDNINMDIILGLPGEGADEVNTTLSEIEKMRPDSLTVHSMAIKRAANMAGYLAEHPEMESINTPEIMEMAADAANRMGMKPYYLYRQKNMSGNFENVGYAVCETDSCADIMGRSEPYSTGKEGIYNILIMEEVQTIVACGAGTVTKRVYGDGRIERCDTVKDVDLYISKIDEMIDRKRQLFND